MPSAPFGGLVSGGHASGWGLPVLWDAFLCPMQGSLAASGPHLITSPWPKDPPCPGGLWVLGVCLVGP